VALVTGYPIMKQIVNWFAVIRPRSAFWRTLRFRFALWVGSFLLVLLVLFGFFVYARLSQGIWTATDDTLRVSAAQAIAAVDYNGSQIHLLEDDPESTVAAELQERGLTIRLFTSDGDMVQASGAFAALPPNLNSLSAARQRRDTFESIQDPYDDERIRIYSAPVIQDGIVVGVIEVAQSLEHVDDTLGQLKTALLIGVPLLSLIAGGGSYLLAARALARIDQITHTVRRISADDLSTRLNWPPVEDEVGRLASTFDDMLTRLDKSFERERRFTADASHELRTPVATIQVIVCTTLENPRSPADYEQALVDIAEEVDRLRTVAEDLLTLARGDGQQPAVREPVDLSMLLHDVTESLRPLAEEKGLTLSLDASDRLIRLFVNLLGNAIKYTEQGTITVEAQHAPDGLLHITITDTGCGIPTDHLPHVFERFYRVEASRTTRGAGLGLTIAQEIAQAHGGTITVTSAVGIGTTFVVTLRPA
jgi:signal transduction histidine kinase